MYILYYKPPVIMSVIVHTKANCHYCVKAKDFLKESGVEFEEVFYDPSDESYESRKNTLVAKTDWRTFPQIFVGEHFVGGFSELVTDFTTLRFHELCATIGIEVEYPDF